MGKYNELFAELNAIKQDVDAHHLTGYQLSEDNKHHFDIVINTMLYIVKNIDVLKHKKITLHKPFLCC